MKPGIFIGIGGSGVKSLAKLKAKIFVNYNGDKKKFVDENSFLFIDTDLGDISKIQSDETLIRMLGDKPIGLLEFIPIGRTVPANVLRAAKATKSDQNDHLKSWMILEDEGKYRPIATSLSTGAGAMRMDGRASIFDNFNDVISKIQAAIDKMARIDKAMGGKISATNFNIKEKNNEKATENANVAPNLWLISGSNGGTGSSMTLDILFILDRIYQATFNQAPSLRLALLTPEPYNRLNPGLSQYPLNSFAFMWELNAFKTNNYKEALMSKLFVNNKYDNPQHFNQTPFNPYSYALVFDTESKKGGAKIELPDTFENVSKVLYMLCATDAGALVNSDMINFLSDITRPHSKPDAPGTLLEDTDWSKSLVATGGKSIEKPNEYLKSYIKTRFLYDIFSYGIIGPDFNDVYTDIEKNIFLKTFITENIQAYLDESKQVTDKSNLEKDIRANFDNIILGSAPVKSWGKYPDGILSSYKEAYSSEIENTISSITSTFDKTGQILSKENFLSQLKTSLKKVLNDAVCEYGLLYVKGLVYSIDCELEGPILVALEKNFNDNYNYSIEQELKSNIDMMASENKEYDALVVACEKLKAFKVNRLVIEKQRELITALSRNGYLDDLMATNGNEKGLISLISKFRNEESILDKDLLSLSTEFLKKSSENPFVTYLPELNEMIGVGNSAQGWKRGSEFEVLYSKMVALDAKEKNVKGAGLMGTPPNRNSKENSLKDHLKNILISMDENNKSYFIDFAEQNDFDKNAKNVKEFKVKINLYLDKLISENETIKGWLENIDLGAIFKNFEANNLIAANNFKAKFSDLPVLYPSTTGTTIGYYIYSFPPELKELASSIGYDEDDKQKKWNKTTDNSKIEVLLLETEHSFDTYKYMRNYVNTYQEKRKNILALDFGCHIHKGFVHLDLDKAISLATEKAKFIEVVFYDVVLEMLFSKNPAIFNQLFAKIDEESDDNNPFAEKITTLPLITIQMTGLSDGTIVYKQIEFILGVNKLNLIKGGTSPISGALDYTSFIKKTLSLNGEFKSIIENLSIAYKKNKDLIGGELNALIQSNFTEIKKTLAKKIGMPTSDKWSLTDKTTFHDIGVELDELKTKNIFK